MNELELHKNKTAYEDIVRGENELRKARAKLDQEPITDLHALGILKEVLSNMSEDGSKDRGANKGNKVITKSKRKMIKKSRRKNR